MRTGGCLCGQVRFKAEGEAGPSNYCHCTDCRRSTGSAFNVGVRFPAESFQVAGPVKGFAKAGDSGRELTRHFCSECGSPLYTTSSSHPALVFVKAGALDDSDIPAVSHESWTASKVSWHRVPDGITSFERGRV